MKTITTLCLFAILLFSCNTKKSDNNETDTTTTETTQTEKP